MAVSLSFSAVATIRLAVLLLLLLPGTACSASFDCSKASTKVEKMICADPELSKLDEKLGKTYSAALNKTPDLLALKQQQRDWLNDRNGCVDAACLQAQYQQRIGELDRVVALIPTTKGQESHYFEKEADKLLVMRDVVRQQQQQLSFSRSDIKEPGFCAEFLNDFAVGKNIKAIEPDLRTNDAEDPRLNKWHHCNKDPEEGTKLDSFYTIRDLGGPPYRYYQIELDRNPGNGKEDLIYHEDDDRGGSTGYAWVDLKACVSKVGGAGVTSWQAMRKVPRNLYRLNTVIMYRDLPLSVEIRPQYQNNWGVHPTLYWFGIRKLGHPQPPYSCAWYSPPQNGELSNTQKSKSGKGR
ncbi:lysozyme inhibitor LprI family protein [Sedimenticola sp.]|uniref:lysozyme inhibitor LprI family protein n=1 Tax=Sedimenticola sp. TaxID=1940285 RepID=UPI003D0CF8FE